jgi:chemotaxis protein methyltransferase CheR
VAATASVLPLLDPAPALSDRDLAFVVKLVYDRAGIRLHDGKRELVTARLQKRLRALGLGSYKEYLACLQQDASGDEMVAFLDAITTNHTYFFREEQHFAYLTAQVLPVLRARPGRPPIEVWSAACSSGEEPYTLAITLADALPADEDFRIFASDLSTKVLATARGGVYKMDRVKGLPLDLLRRHFERGMGDQQGLARVGSHLRRRVDFAQLNLLEIGDLGRRFDVIFCRNVMIYFDRAVQQRVVAMLERHLRPGGYLFISHSESLNGISHGLRWVAPAVYQWRQA